MKAAELLPGDILIINAIDEPHVVQRVVEHGGMVYIETDLATFADREMPRIVHSATRDGQLIFSRRSCDAA